MSARQRAPAGHRGCSKRFGTEKPCADYFNSRADVVNVGLVNIMAMDYGDSAAPNPDGRMGDYAIEVAKSLLGQLQTLYGSTKTDDELWAMIGVTPMIGLNDVVSEVFDQQEARELLAFAQAKGIGRISFWSLNRDQPNAAGELNHVDLKSSSILQDPFEFTQIFLPFME